MLQQLHHLRLAQSKRAFLFKQGFGYEFHLGAAMEEIVEKLYAQTLRAKLQLCQMVCTSLASEFNRPNITQCEKTEIAIRYNDIQRDGEIWKFLLKTRRTEQVEPGEDSPSGGLPRH